MAPPSQGWGHVSVGCAKLIVRVRFGDESISYCGIHRGRYSLFSDRMCRPGTYLRVLVFDPQPFCCADAVTQFRSAHGKWGVVESQG